MLYFKSREAARSFARKAGKKVKDLGAGSPKRWAVAVLPQK